MSQNNPSLAASADKFPSVMRYARVQSILEADDALKAFLGPKDREVTKRNGEKHRYSRGVYLVTNVLHERHFDAHTVDKNTVLITAFEVLREKPPKPEPPKFAPKPALKPEAKVEAKPKLEVKGEPKKPEQKPEPKKPESKPEPNEPKPKAKAIRPQAPKKPELKKAQAKPVSAAAPSAPAPAPSTAAAAEQKPGFVYYIYGTALSLAVTIYKTLEIGDRSPGAEARLDAVSKLIDQLKPLANTAVPMPEDFNTALKHAKAAPNPKG